MPTLRLQVIVPMKSGIARDSAVNVLHWLAPPVTENSLQAIADGVGNFYKLLTDQYSTKVDGAGTRIKMYNMALPEPRVPIYDQLLGCPNPAFASCLPSEIAMCLSFQAPRVSGLEQARRRGRIYLGPWSQNSIAAGTDRPSGSLINNIRDAGSSLLDFSTDATAGTWVVYSRRNDPQEGFGDFSLSPVTELWVDDAWDVQRRRGIDPTSRTKYPAALPPGG